MKTFFLTTVLMCICLVGYAQDKPKVKTSTEKTSYKVGVNTSNNDADTDGDGLDDDIKSKKRKCVKSGGWYIEFSDGSSKCWNRQKEIAKFVSSEKPNFNKDTLDIYGRKRRCLKGGGVWVTNSRESGCLPLDPSWRPKRID